MACLLSPTHADSKGVVAALSQLLYGMNCNIVSSDQCTLEPGPGASPRFYQRLSIDYGDMLVGPGNTAVLERGIAELAQRFNMEWQVAYASKRKRVAVMVSKLDHCLYDILIRRGECVLARLVGRERTWHAVLCCAVSMRGAAA